MLQYNGGKEEREREHQKRRKEGIEDEMEISNE